MGDGIVKPLAGLWVPPEVSFLWLHNLPNTRILRRWWRPIGWKNISKTKGSGLLSRMKTCFFTIPDTFLAQSISIGVPTCKTR